MPIKHRGDFKTATSNIVGCRWKIERSENLPTATTGVEQDDDLTEEKPIRSGFGVSGIDDQTVLTIQRCCNRFGNFYTIRSSNENFLAGGNRFVENSVFGTAGKKQAVGVNQPFSDGIPIGRIDTQADEGFR